MNKETSERKTKEANVRKGKLIINIVLMILALIFILSTIELFGMFNEYHEGDKEYNDLQEYVEFNTEESTEVPTEIQETKENGIPMETDNAKETEIIVPPEPVTLEVNFAELKKINPDIIAWIYVPGGNISYPVTHTNNNQYYLTHTATGKINKNGSIFMSAECSADFTNDNTIIYGHNMKNGAMFANLHNYKKDKTWNNYPYVYIYTEEHALIYQIFSTYTGAANGEAYIYQVGNQRTKSDFFRGLEVLSEHPSDVGFFEDDTIITLSTCLDNNDPNWRYLVHAKLVSKESADKEAVFEMKK